MSFKLNLFLIVLFPSFAFGQKFESKCKCPASIYSGTKTDTVFNLSNNVSVVLCGYRDTTTIKGKILYSEFALSEFGADTIIKFWGAVKLCDVRKFNDTVIVETLVDMPVGELMSYKKIAWTIEHIYPRTGTGEIVRNLIINPSLPKYNKSQILSVFSLYDNTPNLNNDKTIELADKLFMCALSNNNKAKNLLINFKKKYTNLDGVYAEEYDMVMRMLKLLGK